MRRSVDRCCHHISPRYLAIALVLSGVLPVGCSSAADVKSNAAPATVADAIAVIDLSAFPRMKGASEPMSHSVARLSYNAPGDCQQAFDFQRQALQALKWTELPGSTVTDQYASGMMTRDGFLISLAANPLSDPKQPGLVNVSLQLHGNVDPGKLPVPEQVQPVFVGPQVAMYSTDAAADSTREACRKLLLAAGWQPYGQVEGTQWFKQNAIRLTASIGAAPAQGGKTSISYSVEQLSADVPAPAETVQLQYSDSTKQVSFDTHASEAEIVAFYRKTLGESGCRSTTENTIKIGFKNVLIFRGPAQEMFTLEMHSIEDDQVLRVTLQHQTGAEVDAIDKRLDEQMAAKKKQLELEKNTPLPKVKIALPPGAKVKNQSPQRLEFVLATGTAPAAAESLRRGLTAAGWKEEVTVADAAVGEFTFKKENKEISLSYIDPGFIPAEITIDGKRVELER